MAKDFSLLSKPLPSFYDPCSNTNCSGHNGSCCGCPPAREYRADVERFKNAGVYEEALAIVNYRKLSAEKAKIESEMERCEKTLVASNLDIKQYL